MFAAHPDHHELMYVHMGQDMAVVELLPWMWITDGWRRKGVGGGAGWRRK